MNCARNILKRLQRHQPYSVESAISYGLLEAYAGTDRDERKETMKAWEIFTRKFPETWIPFMTRWWNFVWNCEKAGILGLTEFVYFQIVDALIIRQRCRKCSGNRYGM